MLKRRIGTTTLRSQLADALRAQRVERALDLYQQIERSEPDEPRWSHRKGDLLQRMGRKADAVLAYQRCVELYAAKGFVARAAAMAKMIVAIDPSKGEVLDRVDPTAARALHRETRRAAASGTTDDLQLGFTDVELVRRPAPPEPRVSQRPCAGTLAQLPSMLLFADVPPGVLEALVRESTLIDVQDGQRFVTAGTAADALYVLIEGNAVEQRKADVQSLLLGEGDVAGVCCLLSDVSYGADVVACGRARVLRISKLLLDRLVEEFSPFHDVLLEILSRRLVATLFRTNPIFAAFDETTRTQVARLFKARRTLAGTRLFEAGEAADGVCLPLHGCIIATRKDGARLGRIELGRPLGQNSILTRSPSPATFEALSDVLVLWMPANVFSDLLITRPDVVQQMSARQRRESGHSFSFPSGVFAQASR